ncbi:MAG: SAM-dependent methyltransferase [Pelagibacterales bacterium]|nr:SAM-dependent methyltransferase [Pelagibacterales bacterium]|tara:strand:+ start:3745 stop:4872 length:1128 start_codon:yes stop_codon:yes gene_type:complete
MNNPIDNHLNKIISQKGDLLFSDFMDIALYHDQYGYYNKQNSIFGAKGDFITAPIASSFFGESISNEFINLSSEIKNASILELGGGDASLAISLLKRLEEEDSLPVTYIIIETSKQLKTLQKNNIKKLIPNLAHLVKWQKDLSEKSFEGLIIANEFFDALPSERFKYSSEGLKMSYVSSIDHQLSEIWKESTEEFKNEFILATDNMDIKFSENYISELNLHYSTWVNKINKALERGVCIITDYGYNNKEYFLEDRTEGTLVCIYNHKANFDPLYKIGEQDISTFVNFSHLSKISENIDMNVCGYLTQYNFLINLGILNIFENKKFDDIEKHVELNRLKNILLPNAMGELFKVLILKKNINSQLLSTKEFNHLHKL